MNKIIKWLVGLAVAVLVGFLFLYRMYHRDVRALKDFSAADEKFDKAVSDFSTALFVASAEGTPATDDLKRKADDVLAELKSKAVIRISSLIKNDAEFMRLTREIADLSAKELDMLNTYKSAAADKPAESDRLAKEFEDLRHERQAAHARFRELAGLKD